MSTKKVIAGVAVALFPLFAFAQSTPTFTWSEAFIRRISTLVGLMLPIVMAIGLLLFFWGLVIFISKSGSEDAHEDGKRKMIWGVITFFVMISIWGLVTLIGQELGIQAVPNAPTIPSINGSASTGGTGGGVSGGVSGGGTNGSGLGTGSNTSSGLNSTDGTICDGTEENPCD